VHDPDGSRAFADLLMPHLDASYNLARWLMRSPHDAEDVVQEAYLRAFRAFDRYRGGDARAWLLRIVRNACYAWLRQQSGARGAAVDVDVAELAGDPAAEPEAQIIRRADGEVVRRALEELPVPFREALVLRELEGLSYKEIAEIADVPLGTVMSRLARARRLLAEALGRDEGGPGR
jgi:RNA polymerase sigma-70 factor, ECF subfamily